MRLWTIHPKYLDQKGLTALWREALLAKAVLSGNTKGYKHHPQLERFRKSPDPVKAINLYLSTVCKEAEARGYSFNRDKICSYAGSIHIKTTAGQLVYEWQHLLAKLKLRSPEQHKKVVSIRTPEHHPIFKIIKGDVEDWEHVKEYKT
ncbi:MAG: hypothetical protein JXR79_07000 [Nitrospirae bacterium]|nr:hypothetical protein [Nitrospirota bacterium]